MSELKAISGNEIREDIDYNTRGIDPEDKEWRTYGKELCDTLYYRKSEADKVIADKDKEIAKLERQIEFLKVTHSSCGDCNKCADGMGKVFDENLNELKVKNAQLEDDAAFWKAKVKGEM